MTRLFVHYPLEVLTFVELNHQVDGGKGHQAHQGCHAGGQVHHPPSEPGH